MSRLPAPTETDLTAEERRIYDRVRQRESAYGSETAGGFRGWFNFLLICPQVADTALNWRNVARALIPPYFRNFGILITGLEFGNLRMLSDHMGDAISDGMRPEAIKALMNGLDHLLTPEELQHTQFVRQFLHGTVTDASFEVMLGMLGPKLMVAYLYFIGMVSNSTLVQLAVRLEQPSLATMRDRLHHLTEIHRIGGDLSPWLATANNEFVADNATTTGI